MKYSKGFALIFGIMGVLLACFTVWLCLTSLNAEPVLIRSSEGANACAVQMLDAVCSGDYAGAGAFLYGSPKLQSGAETESESGRLIWEAFINSLEYELVGDNFMSAQGVSQKVRLHRLDFDSVTRNLSEIPAAAEGTGRGGGECLRGLWYRHGISGRFCDGSASGCHGGGPAGGQRVCGSGNRAESDL